MTKITMAQVYDRIYEERLDELKIAASENREVIRYSFEDFSRDLRKNDLVTTTATIKQKWESAIADRVITTAGKKYTMGFLFGEELERVLRIPSRKRVCVYVCVNHGQQGEIA